LPTESDSVKSKKWIENKTEGTEMRGGDDSGFIEDPEHEVVSQIKGRGRNSREKKGEESR